MLTVTDEVLVTADYNTIATPLTLTSLSPSLSRFWKPRFYADLEWHGFHAELRRLGERNISHRELSLVARNSLSP